MKTKILLLVFGSLLMNVLPAFSIDGKEASGGNTRHFNVSGVSVSNGDNVSAENAVGTVVALYNAGTDGNYPVYASGTSTYISKSTSATPQLFVLRTNGTDSYGGVYFNLQAAEGNGKYLRHSSSTSGTLSTTATNYLFLNTSATSYSRYSWGTGSCPSSPYYTMIAYMSSASKKYCCLSNYRSNTSWYGYSRTYNNLYYKNAARLSSYNTRWVLVSQPYTVYNLTVTGLSDVSSVSVAYSNSSDAAISRSSQSNGGFFAISNSVTPIASMFTATEVDGYDYTVSISGTTVTVTYAEESSQSQTNTSSYSSSIDDGSVYALYNVTTDGGYPVSTNSSSPAISTSTSATPQYFVLRANGTDAVGGTLYNLQLAEGSGKYLAWTNGSPTSVTYSTSASKFTFPNSASSGYTWSSGSAPTSPLVNLLGYYNGYYTVFCDNKSTTSTSFNGYSNKSYSTLLNNTQAAKGSVYNTTWGLIKQPYTTYNVSVTGLTDNSAASVTYTNSSDAAITRTAQTNGGFFAISDDVTPTASMFSVTNVDGYNSTITISGNNITVAYTQATTTYTVAISGLTDNSAATVTYNGTSVSNGGTFTVSSGTSLTASMLTASSVAGYSSNITISGTTINVVYTATYTTYTVAISGLANNSAATVTYNGTSVSNGGTFTVSSATTLTASMLTASTVAGYTSNITVSGTTINVVYTETYTTYTVAISGLTDNSAASVSYNGTSVSNGGTFSISDLVSVSTSLFTASDVDGYTSAISISGTTINVVYTEIEVVTSVWDNYTAISSTDNLSNSKVYAVLPYDTNRGTWYYYSSNAPYMYSTAKAGVDADPTDANQQFAIMQTTSGWYIYSIGAQQFFTKDASAQCVALADVPASAGVTFAASTGNYTSAPFVVQIDGSDIGVSNGYTNPLITFWTSKEDGGNCVNIYEVGNIDASSYWNALNGIYSYEGQTEQTYTINYTGVPNGSTASVTIGGIQRTSSLTTCIPYGTSPFALSDIVPTTIDGYDVEVTVSGTTINVVYTDPNASPYAETLQNGKVYALYNVTTDGGYPVSTNSSSPAISTSTSATPQYFVLRANGTDAVSGTLYNLQLAEGSGKYLAWTNGSPTSVTYSTSASTFTFPNSASTGYTWSSGSAPTSPLVNLLGYYNGYYTVFCDNKSTTSTSFNGYSNKSYSTLLNNTQAAKGSVYNTIWGLIKLPYTVYDVTVTGLTDNSAATVTYTNSNDAAITRTAQTNGGFFAISDAVTPDASMFTATTVSGYTCEVSVNGTTITATYTADQVVPTTVDITYNYTYGGTTWYTETKTATVGEAYPDLYPCPTGVLYTSIPTGKVTATSATTVDVACSLKSNYWIVPSSSYNSATWFFLSIHDSDPSYIYYNSSNTEKLSYTSAPANSDAYKWAFLGDPFSGYKIINKAAGSAMILTSADPTLDSNTGGATYPHMETESSINTESYNIYWDFKDNNAGFLLARKGENVYCNRRNSTLAYWTSAYDGGSRMYIIPTETLSSLTSLSAVVDADGTALSTSKQYRLVNRYTGKAIDASSSLSSGSYCLTAASPANDEGQAWNISYNSGFRLQNASTSQYLTGSQSGWSAYAGITSSSSTAMYIYEADIADGVQYYYISPSSSVALTNATGRTFLSDGGSYIYPYTTTANIRSQWALEEVTLPEYATSLTSGSYYRLVSNSYPTLSMADAGSSVATLATNENSYAQIWQISGSNGSYKLKNLLTGKYIGTAPGTSCQWTTGASSSAGSFYSGTTTSDDNTLFWFATSNSTSTYNALHSAASQSYYVVGWTGSADASKWLLQEVSLSSSDLTAVSELQSALSADYTSNLTTYFTDYACTELNSTYAGYTDAALRTAMSSLPSALQEMAVKVKNDTWNSNATWNAYEKDFRIHDYEVFSEPAVWASKLGYGPFGRLTQPTGIKLAANEVAYIFVDSDVADSDAQLFAELVTGVDVKGTQTALQKGYNAVLANGDCEVFITYNCTNTDRALSDFPNIKIHIEGGTCNGFYDLSRGHTNNDWYWLASNMFSNEYLHVKGNSTILNCYLDRVQDASQVAQCMQIWDFVFQTEHALMVGNTYDGYYRPFICNRDITSGNPYWTSGGGVGYTNYPGIYSSGLLNFNSLVYSGTDGGQQWVIEHEEGHGHQSPFNISGSSEVSNNALAQMVNHLWGYRSSRGTAQQQLVWFFNNGFSWVDLMRATNKYGNTYMNSSSYNTNGWSNVGTNSIWLSNKLWYQLWLYFHLQGDDEFFPRFISKIAEYGGIVKSTSKSSPASYKTDYMRMALAACEAANTDLYEFFKAWGFFNYGDAINTNSTIYTSIDDFSNYDGTLGDGIYCITDYSTYYIQMPLSTNSEDVAYLAQCKATMQAYQNKAPGLLFINDSGELTEITANDKCTKYDASLIGTSKQYADNDAAAGAGCTGHYTLFVNNESGNLSANLSGTTITVTGSGAVGYKVYDNNGEMIWISMSNQFDVTSAIASALNTGTYSLVATFGDGSESVLLGSSSYASRLGGEGITDINGISATRSEQPNAVYDLQGRRVNKQQDSQIYIVNGKKVRK